MDSESRHSELVLELQEVSKLYHTFLEWRHKVLLRFGVVLAAVAVAANSYFGAAASTRSKVVLVAALVAGAGFSGVAAFMDRRNEEIIDTCRNLGSEIEATLGVADLGLFCRLAKEEKVKGLKSLGRYRTLMQVVYLSTCVALTASGAYAAITY